MALRSILSNFGSVCCFGSKNISASLRSFTNPMGSFCEFGTKYKLKSKSALKERFSLTSKGKIKRFRAGARHILTKKSSNRKSRLGNSTFLEGKIKKNILKMM